MNFAFTVQLCCRMFLQFLGPAKLLQAHVSRRHAQDLDAAIAAREQLTKFLTESKASILTHLNGADGESVATDVEEVLRSKLIKAELKCLGSRADLICQVYKDRTAMLKERLSECETNLEQLRTSDAVVRDPLRRANLGLHFEMIERKLAKAHRSIRRER